nr:hypothetical protein [Sicyoidochytrium minutum DNA virus]
MTMTPVTHATSSQIKPKMAAVFTTGSILSFVHS